MGGVESKQLCPCPRAAPPPLPRLWGRAAGCLGAPVPFFEPAFRMEYPIGVFFDFLSRVAGVREYLGTSVHWWGKGNPCRCAQRGPALALAVPPRVRFARAVTGRTARVSWSDAANDPLEF